MSEDKETKEDDDNFTIDAKFGWVKLDTHYPAFIHVDETKKNTKSIKKIKKKRKKIKLVMLNNIKPALIEIIKAVVLFVFLLIVGTMVLSCF